MNFSVVSHCGGDLRVPGPLKSEIERAISTIEINRKKGAAPHIRSHFLRNIRALGWPGEVGVARGSDMTITSAKSGVGLCLQTGNMGRMYADLMKLQTMYLDKGIGSAIFILPSQPLALQIGDNVAHASRLGRELEIFRKAYNVPTLIFGLE